MKKVISTYWGLVAILIAIVVFLLWSPAART